MTPGGIWRGVLWGLRKLFVLPILVYRYVISPALPDSCIYSPSCSRYAQTSIERFGLPRGLLLGFARIFRCAGGLFTGGDDPVPERFSLAAIRNGYRQFRRPRGRA